MLATCAFGNLTRRAIACVRSPTRRATFACLIAEARQRQACRVAGSEGVLRPRGLVAEPLENAISGVSRVDAITPNSSQGTCSVFVQLVDGYDPNASPILNLAFTGAPLDHLYDIASNQIQPQLVSVPGVGQVNISGGLQREIQVQLDYNKLAAYGVTVRQVSQLGPART